MDETASIIEELRKEVGRLRGLQASTHTSRWRPYAIAITKIEEAIHWLENAA